MNGLAFLTTNFISQSSTFRVIAQMLVQVPMFKRELAKNMYTPTMYFLGRYFSNLAFQLFYPISQILITIKIHVSWFRSESTHHYKMSDDFSHTLKAIGLNLASYAQGYKFGSFSHAL